jgi:hypothetical protein
MKELNHCPSTLADGFSTYSPTACKTTMKDICQFHDSHSDLRLNL